MNASGWMIGLDHHPDSVQVCVMDRLRNVLRNGSYENDALVIATIAEIHGTQVRQTYDQMPAQIKVREVHVHVGQPGFRTESFVVVTTLTNVAKYTKDDLAKLYHCRWLVELDIRAIKIKITLGMDILRCKTPEMLRKEMWMCLLACNLKADSFSVPAVSRRAGRYSPRRHFVAGGYADPEVGAHRALLIGAG